MNKDFVSPSSIKSDKSIKNDNVNIIDLRGSFHNNYKNIIKRINVSQNKNYNNSFAKGASSQNNPIALILNCLENKQNFKKVIPKIGPSNCKIK